jgi:hypothetical protein
MTMPKVQRRRGPIHSASWPAVDPLDDANRFPFTLPEP